MPEGDVHLVVPTPDVRDALADLPSPESGDLVVHMYDGGPDLPADAERAQVWVPPFLAGPNVVAAAERMPDLRLVQLPMVGVENFAGRLRPGVLLCNARGAPSSATAEWCVGVLIATYRAFPRFVLAQAEGRWDWGHTEELAGKRVLIVGAGDVAGLLQRRLLAMDVEVTMVARRPRDGVHAIMELPLLLGRADAVVLLVPLTDETRGLIGAAQLARMPDGAMLVNAARGPVVDTDALLAELTAGRLRAAVDVTDPEPLPAGHPLWDAPNLLLTPHTGGSVPSTGERAVVIVRDQMRRYLTGRPLNHVVAGAY